MTDSTLSGQSGRRHVVMFSGGIGSWATAKRVVEQHGTDGLVLLFADTRVEDEDTYRFLHAAAANVGGDLVIVADGRTPFEVFHDDRFLGNHRLANCSKYLKQKPCREWIDANCDPASTALYVGIDWTEVHRLPAIERGWAPWDVAAPLCSEPYLDKTALLAVARAAGLEPPADYAIGLPHANCGAQGCVRGGQAYWATLLRERRDVYLATEAAEFDLRDYLDADVSILDDRVGGTRSPVTLAAFRERIEQQGSLFDALDFGACGCFTDDPEEVADAA